MSFPTTISYREVIKKSVVYKMKSNLGYLLTLVIVQLVGLAFSAMATYTSGNSFIRVETISADFVLGISFLWMFILGVQLINKDSRSNDVHFVINGTTQVISNVMILILASIICGLTSFMSGYILRVFHIIFGQIDTYYYVTNTSISAVVIGLSGMTLYAFVFGMIGYFISNLMQWYKVTILIVVMLVVGFDVLMEKVRGDYLLFESVKTLYFQQPSFLSFVVHVSLLVAVLFGVTILVARRLEVR
ncbi:hypothetical protein [Alkalihalobacillus pseudalcaliphilus]|uniref:hypothetical protein n=1 Tax=Alkalihalobacillus pseudalcaliphilus TaxID=79884 RepID=UPI00064DA281|nr:hypothetical protein [Alkalihalobacillus pseudalcaliphilus]KMK75533.1 hypothetical protein AB990_09550 [Alkalihalobacillus pseudalcaliphilus]